MRRGSQPKCCASGARASDGSAMRPPMTTSAPASKAGRIASAPRYAFMPTIGRPTSRSVPSSSMKGVSGSRQTRHLVALDAGDLQPVQAELARDGDRALGRGTRVRGAHVGDDRRAGSPGTAAAAPACGAPARRCSRAPGRAAGRDGRRRACARPGTRSAWRRARPRGRAPRPGPAGRPRSRRPCRCGRPAISIPLPPRPQSPPRPPLFGEEQVRDVFGVCLTVPTFAMKVAVLNTFCGCSVKA